MSFFDGGGPGSLNYLLKCSPQHWHGDMVSSVFDLASFDVIFMIVRDPLSRAKSEFFMRNKGEAAEKLLDPEYFSSWFRSAVKRFRSNPFAYDNHIRPQLDFFIPGCQVYKFEDGLGRVFKSLDEQLGSLMSFEGERLLSSKKLVGMSSSDLVLPDEAVNMVRDFYYEDYYFFGYLED